MTRFGLWLVIALFVLVACSSGTTRAQTSSPDDQAALAELAAQMLDALGRQDTAFFNEHMLLDGQLASIRKGQAGTSVRFESNRDFVEGLPGDGPTMLERMWEPTVMVKGRIGIVWTPYDFHLDGEFSHCGIDVLTFMKLDDGWKLASISWTVVQDKCEPSPLGKPY